MKSTVRFIAFATKLLLMCILLHFSSVLPSAKLSAAPPPKDHAAEAKASTASKTATAKAVSLPLFFEANKGQTDPHVRFLTRSAGYMLFLTPTETVLAEAKTRIASIGNKLDPQSDFLSTPGAVVKMQLLGANSDPAMTGLEELPGKVNYLIGKDPSQWHTGVSLFSKVRTEQVYPGVDLVFHGDQKQLEYDFVVAPGANPSEIKFRITGAARMEIDARGDLVLHTSGSDFRMHKPVIYQTIGSERRVIEGNFVRKGKHEIAFRLANYDHAQALVIDPSVSFASWLGGDGDDAGLDLVLDTTIAGAPKMYVPGFTNDITTFPASDFTSSGSPKTLGASGGLSYSFLAKIDPTTTGAASLIYLTFIGGSKSRTTGVGCATLHGHLVLDFSQGTTDIEPVMVGQTSCTDFPVTSGSFTSGGQDNYVTRLTPSGAALDVSILFGGNGLQGGGWADVDGSGNVLLVGGTTSTDLPTTTGAYSPTLNNGTAGGYDDCFVAAFNRALTTTSYVTYLDVGATSTETNTVLCGGLFGPLTASGVKTILAGGNTLTSTAFANAPSGTGGFQTTFEGTEDTFAMALDPSKNGVNQLIYWTFIGGGASTIPDYGAVPIGGGVVAIVGNTTSSAASNPPDIPVNNCFQNTNTAASSSDKGTGWLMILDATKTGSASLVCGTYFGGSGGDDKVQSVGFDPVGGSGSYRILLGGQTTSTDFPVSANALQSTKVGSQDAFVSVLTIPSVAGSGSGSPFGTLTFSTYIGGGVTASGESETVQGVAADTNHDIYARARSLSPDFFGHTSPATTVNGFQATCTSCGLATPADDIAIFVISSLPGATLESIAVTPASPSIAEGATQQFTATGTYSDGTIQDLTATATWASTATSIAMINTAPAANPGLATASPTNSGTTQITAAQGGVTSPAVTLTVEAPVTVHVMTAGNGFGTVTDNLGQINCEQIGPGVISGACNTQYASGTQVTFTATTPGTVASFIGTPTACTNTTSTTCQMTLTATETVTATINAGPGTLPLTVQAGATNHTGGGTITSSPAGITCMLAGTTTSGTCTANFPAGTFVTLMQVPGGGSSFFGWTGTTPSCLTSSSVSCVVGMSAATTVDVEFTSGGGTVNVTVNGPGNVKDTANPSTINCSNTTGGTQTGTCTSGYALGTTVTLMETPTGTATFSGWTGASCANPTATTCSFIVTTATPPFAVTATFAAGATTTFPLTVTDAGNGTGTVTTQMGLSPAISCTSGSSTGCMQNYSSGQSITLTAQGTGGSTFAAWTMSTPTPCTVSTNTCTFSMPASAEAVTATFNPPSSQSFPLLANFAGSGSGTVTSQTGLTPAFNCSGAATQECSAMYNSGALVTLTATPASGSIFMGWVGGTTACSGTGTCSVTMSEEQTVTAIFNTSGPLIVADWNVSGDGDNDKQRIDGKTPPLLVTLTNTSTTQTVHVSKVTADNSAYTIATTCGTLGPGQTCTVSSSFAATALCQVQDTSITVTDDDPGGNFQFTIEGFGADSGLQVDDLTDPTLTAQALAQSLVGPGVTISNVTYTGAKRAAGTFTSTSNIIGFNNGAVLSTGSVRNTVGPNCSTGISVDNGEPGDSDLNNLASTPTMPVTTNDAAVLQFDFVPTSTSISFQYVFASDEYPEFVGQFNDTFGFFLNGTNIALVPGTNPPVPVSINNVNGGTNPQFFVNNNFQFPTAAPVDTEMDGLTVVLTAQAQVTPGNTYHIKLGIADALDFALDSNVFIKAGSLSSSDVSFNPTSVAFGNQTVGVQSNGVPVTLTNNGTTAVTISNITATAPFNSSGSCPQLAPTGQSGSSCTINVTITPSSTTTFTGSLTVTDDSPTAGSQQSIPLTGTGVASAPATHFMVSAPASATAGTGFTFTVTALTATNTTATGYTGTVHFTSTDTAAVLPANSTLTDGTGTFTATLNTAGSQTITATDTVTATITGTSGTITVTGVGPTPILAISKSHVGNFSQGQQGAQYMVTVSNSQNAPTGGTQSATVQATGSIYDTGDGSTPPTMITLPAGATSVVFSSVTGSITTGCASSEGCIVLNNGTGNNANDPDGVGAAPATSSNTGTSSISGIAAAPGAGYLVGVFVPAGGPSGPAPAALNFTSSGLGTSFTSLSPQLDQTFFIGDGLTGNGTGTLQTFNIPTGAGQLWLGISDAPGYNGAPGAYGDNLGTYTVNLTLNTPSSSPVTVTETPPSGLALVSMAGTGWTCGSPNPANACTRSDALAGGASYPVITVTVNVAANATSPQVNMVSVTGGGSAPANASDSTVIVSASTTLVSIAVTPANATVLTGQTEQYTATGTYSDNSTKNLTTQVTWASSNTEAATISNATGSQGLATAASSLTANATTTISATLGEVEGSTMLTVTSSPVIITVAPPPPGQPVVPTINPGGAAAYGLVLTSQPGFNGTVTLLCTATTSTGAPASQFINCLTDPSTVTIKPGGTKQVAIVLNTYCSRNAPLDMPVPGGPAGVLIVVLTALGLASMAWMYRRRPRWVLSFAVLVIAAYSIVGCGSTPTGPAGRTPAGTYFLNLSFTVNGGPPIPGPQLQLIIK